MDAEKFLERIKKIDLVLRNKRREYNRWVEAVDGGGGSSGERVQSSRNLHRGSEAIGNYVDIEKEIQRLERERYGIIKTIEELPSDEYTVIYGIYVDGLSLKEIAYNERKSYEWVKSHRRKGINIIDKLINGGAR
jgi:DNA-directed RNA polymerase specialized sigma24 family protein